MLLDDKYRVKNPYTIHQSSISRYYGSVISIYKDRIRVLQVEPIDASSYRGDFYGLLVLSDVSKSLYGINLYLNRLSSSIHYNGALTVKLINDPEVATLLDKLSK